MTPGIVGPTGICGDFAGFGFAAGGWTPAAASPCWTIFAISAGLSAYLEASTCDLRLRHRELEDLLVRLRRAR
jgi:hypothetical protein